MHATDLLTQYPDPLKALNPEPTYTHSEVQLILTSWCYFKDKQIYGSSSTNTRISIGLLTSWADVSAGTALIFSSERIRTPKKVQVCFPAQTSFSPVVYQDQKNKQTILQTSREKNKKRANHILGNNSPISTRYAICDWDYLTVCLRTENDHMLYRDCAYHMIVSGYLALALVLAEAFRPGKHTPGLVRLFNWRCYVMCLLSSASASLGVRN